MKKHFWSMYLLLTVASLVGADDQDNAESLRILGDAVSSRGAVGDQALSLLGTIPGEKARKMLEGALNSADGAEIAQVARGLTAALCAAYLPELERAASASGIDGDEPAIWDAIARSGTTQAAEYLVELANKQDPPSQTRAGSAFGLLGSMGQAAAPALATEVETGPSPWHRETAAYVLGRLAARSAVPAFQAALRDNDRSVRLAGALGLAKLGSAAGQSQLEAAANASNQDDKVEALAALSFLGIPEAVLKLRSLVTGSDSSLKGKAVWAIARWGGQGLKKLAYEIGLQSRPEFQAMLADRLLDSSNPTDRALLTSILDSQDETTRIIAAERLISTSQDSRARDIIAQTFSSQNEAARRLALDFAARSGSFYSEEAKLIASSDPTVKQRAIEAAGKLHQRKDFALVRQELTSSVPGVSLAAARALVLIDPSAAREALRDGLKSERADVRLNSAAVLLSYPDSSVTPQGH